MSELYPMKAREVWNIYGGEFDLVEGFDPDELLVPLARVEAAKESRQRWVDAAKRNRVRAEAAEAKLEVAHTFLRRIKQGWGDSSPGRVAAEGLEALAQEESE